MSVLIDRNICLCVCQRRAVPNQAAQNRGKKPAIRCAKASGGRVLAHHGSINRSLACPLLPPHAPSKHKSSDSASLITLAFVPASDDGADGDSGDRPQRPQRRRRGEVAHHGAAPRSLQGLGLLLGEYSSAHVHQQSFPWQCSIARHSASLNACRW
jgi:hypothetical protein